MVKIKFYFKPGCWLCDTVEEQLRGIKESHGLEIERIDISADEELYELYRFDIPVFEFEDGTTLHGRIKRKTLLEAINNNG